MKKVIKKFEKKLSPKGKKKGLPLSQDKKDALLFRVHQKKRHVHILEEKVAKLVGDPRIHLCFGGKKLFNEQFHPEGDGDSTRPWRASHDEWLNAWRRARSSEFVVLGSKDETSGCQGCTATLMDDGSSSLRLRLPSALTRSGRHVLIEGLRFAYGQQNIAAALLLGRALTYRFKREEKGWRVFVSTSAEAPKIVTSRAVGAIGMDVNAGCLAVSEIDRYGNLVRSRVIPCATYGKTSNQRKAVIGDGVKDIVTGALRAGKPLVAEKLDFSKKNAEIERTNPGRARMISALAYAQIQGMLRAAAFRTGVEVIEVNPAFTSTIGAVNYAQRYGISVHQSAALVIARRGLGFSERPAMRDGAVVPTRNGGHVTFFLPVRNREKHVWSFWSVARTRLSAARAAHARSGGPKGSPAPLRQLGDNPTVPAVGPTWALPARLRHAIRQQNCLAGEDDIPVAW